MAVFVSISSQVLRQEDSAKNEVKASLPALECLHSQDEEVLAVACWALSCVSDVTNQDAVDSALCPRLVELVHPDPSLLIPALSATGNIFTSDNMQTQVKATLLAVLECLHSQDEEVVAVACWAISYLSDGTIQDVVDSVLCPRLVELVHPDPSLLIPALSATGYTFTSDSMQTQVKAALLERLHSDDEEVLEVARWTLSWLSDGTIQAVIDSVLGPRQVELVHPVPSVLVLTGDEEHTQVKAALVALGCFRSQDEEEEFFLAVACWALSYLSVVIGSVLCPRLVELVHPAAPSLLTAALCISGYYLFSSDIGKQTQVLIQANIIGSLLQNAKFGISNATSGGFKD